MTLPIEPAPPIAAEELAHIGAGLRFMDAPTDYLQELRRRHGDTFLLDVFGFQLLMTFAPRGLQRLYELAEEQASFGLATFDLIGFKTPTEIFLDVDTELFRELLLHKRMPGYLGIMDEAVERELQRWGNEGELEIFDAIRTLEQRTGFALWIAPEAADDRFWRDLKRPFDVLDQAQAFVAPQLTLETIKSGKAAERAALEEIKRLLPAIVAAHDRNPTRQFATVDLLRERFAGQPAEIAERKLAHNIVNANQGFLSNLYAAIGWVIVRLLQHPAVLARVRTEIADVRARHGTRFRRSVDALNELRYCEQVLMESVRLGQRSLTLRKVLQPLEFDDGNRLYTVQPGVYIATMLSVGNVQTDDLLRFDPEHYNGRELRRELLSFGKESISTFGHGRHACPAQRFSHHMCKIVISRLLERFELEALFDDAQPSSRQMGGVARPQDALKMHFAQRHPD